MRADLLHEAFRSNRMYVAEGWQTVWTQGMSLLPSEGTLSRAESIRSIQRIDEKLTSFLGNRAQALPSALWLMLMRLAPHGPEQQGEYDRVRSSAEFITGGSQNQMAVPLERIPTDGQIRRAARMIGGVAALERFRDARRTLGSNGMLRVIPGPAPEIEIMKEADDSKADVLFESRLDIARSRGFEAITGYMSLGHLPDRMSEDDPIALMPCSPFQDQTDLLRGLTHDPLLVAPWPVQFLPGTLSPAGLGRARDRNLYRYVDPGRVIQIASLLLLQRQLSMDLLIYAYAQWTTVLGFGLIIKPGEEFNSFFERAGKVNRDWLLDLTGIDPTTMVDELIAASLDAGPVSSSRYEGPAVRAGAVGWIVDFVAVARRLARLCDLGITDGKAATRRGSIFEDDVRRVMKNSRWSPYDAAERYVGRTLILDGNQLSDVDAIGEMGETLLLVSAKSYRRDGRYESGDAVQIGRRASDLRAAADDWERLILTLRDRPKGDNYDFRPWRRLVGVVVTPGPFWLPLGLANRQSMPGLRMLSSVTELESVVGHAGGSRES